MPERTNGRKHTINVNKIVYKELHRPKVVDFDLTFPIYTKVEGYKGNERDTRAESSKKYLARSKTHYNSANNIRKIFITHNKIYIDYYKAPGAQSFRLSNMAQANLSEDLLDILPKIATYQQDLAAYYMEKNINPKAVGPDQYKIEGNLLGIINQLYVCSNIEEIYFDWTYLFSWDIQQTLINHGLQVLTGDAALVSLLNGQPVCDRLIKSDIWRKWFEASAFNVDEYNKLLREPSRFRDKYPRLRIIAMVSNLGDIIDSSVKAHSIINELRNGGEPTWLIKNANLLNQSNSTIIVSQIDNTPNINTKFTTQENTYLFDQDFTKWVENYKKSAEDHNRQAKYGAADTSDDSNTQEENIEVNDIEKRLLDIEAEVGPEKFSKILKGTTIGAFKMNELRSLFRSFTKPNRIRWAKIINLTLE